MSEVETVPAAPAVPVVPAAPAEVPSAPAENVVAQEAEPKDTEEGDDKPKSRNARRLDRWRQRAIEAETRLKLQQEQGVQQRPTPSTTKAEPADDEPVRGQFGTYEEFVEARAEWKGAKAAERALREAIKRDEQSRIHESQQKQAREWSSRIDSARDDIEDFDDVCGESDVTLTHAMSEAIMESDRGPHISYYLAKNPAEAERIAKLSRSKQVAAIVALEDRVAKPVKTPSKAPAPINPVNKSSGPEGDLPSDKDDTATWMRKERARMEKLGIR